MSAFHSLALGSNPASANDLPATGQVIPLSWFGAALIASTFIVALLIHGAGLSIDPLAPATLNFTAAFAALALIRFGYRRPSSISTRIIHDIAEYIGLLMAISLLGTIASYPVASYSDGFYDRFLYRSDVALHFHWLSWYQMVAAHPLIQLLSRAAYSMIYVSPVILLGYLAMTHQRREAQNFLAAIWVSAVVTLIAFRFAPAVGPFAYLWHGPIPYLPISDLWQPELIPKLREHVMPIVDLGHLVGLVSVPSFHAATGVLLLIFAARQPTIRAPLVIANVAMLAATPVEGTHYLTDVILGAVVACMSLWLVCLVLPKLVAQSGE